MIRTLALTTALVAAPFAAMAEWEVDPTHQHITFEVSHLGFSNTQGQFNDFTVSVENFDPENIEAVSVSATINAASISTGHEPRDAHLMRADFLGVDNNPEITFTSTSIESTGETTAIVTGDLTMLGETREVSFDAVLQGLGANPFNPSQQIAGFTVSGDVNRADFGMDFGVPVIPAEIPVVINIDLINNG